jgi:hypothetical protein
MNPLKTILISFPIHGVNPGDWMALYGILDLLYMLYEKDELLLYYTDEKGEVFDAGYKPCENVPDHFNLLLAAGTPWLWDQCEKSDKYKQLIATKERFTFAHKILWGAGSCYWLQDMDHARKTFPKEQMAAVWGDFDLIIPRDFFASELFHMLEGLEGKIVNTCCPSQVWAQQGKRVATEEAGVVLVGMHPEGPHPGAPMPADLMERMAAFQNDAVELGAGVLCVFERDYEYWKHKADAAVTFFNTPEQVQMYLAAATSEVMSTRVHQAVCSHGMGIPTTLFPVDTRAFTCSRMGIELEGADLPESDDFEVHEMLLEVIKELLQ